MMEATDPRMVWEFFHDRLGLHHSEDFRGVMHIPEEYQYHQKNMNHVAVAVGYNSFIGRTCCIHVVIQRPELFTRKILREAFEFPFLVCGLQAVLGLVDSTNEAAINLNERLGFKPIAVVPGGGTEGDLIVMQMLRGDCRWIRKDH